MSLKLINYIGLPADARPAAFGRPTLNPSNARLYIPMADSGGLAVVDCGADRYLHTIADLPGVDAVLASDQGEVLFATVPGNSQVVVISAQEDRVTAILASGGTPHELAYDPIRGHLLVAFADLVSENGDFWVAVLDVVSQSVIGDIRVPGLPRQVLYDRQSDMFYIVVADPAQIVILDANTPTRVAHAFDVSVPGLHSIAVGPQGTRLFCACDDSLIITIDRRSGNLLSRVETSGAPDAVRYNPQRDHLYVMVADRGRIDLIDTMVMKALESTETEPGARHLAFDQARHRIYALLPETRRVAVYEDA